MGLTVAVEIGSTERGRVLVEGSAGERVWLQALTPLDGASRAGVSVEGDLGRFRLLGEARAGFVIFVDERGERLAVNVSAPYGGRGQKADMHFEGPRGVFKVVRGELLGRPRRGALVASGREVIRAAS